MDYRAGLHKDIGKVEPAGPELFVMPMWTEDYCRHIVERLENQHQFLLGQGYQAFGENTKIKTTDVKLTDLPDVHSGYLKTYDSLLQKVIQKIWLVVLNHSDAFFTRHSMDSQTRLRPHIDDSSVVSMTIKLNNEFTGGALNFVRQNLVNTQVPVGHICFFPSGCTHIHEVLPLESGKRYAITFWTKPRPPA
jgi:hypothetical protein